MTVLYLYEFEQTLNEFTRKQLLLVPISENAASILYEEDFGIFNVESGGFSCKHLLELIEFNKSIP